jgi:hypothetical protein
MAQALQIEPQVFDEAPIAAPAGASVASEPMTVAAAQPLPVWYLTPVAIIPIAAAAFIIGNVLMMIPWSVL